MFIIFPPVFFILFSYTAFDTLKVPSRSISTTVLKPFADKVSNGAKKFPAAPFTKISIYGTLVKK